MAAKSNRFGDSNNQCKIVSMSTTTTMNTLDNQQHQQLSGEQQQKALAVRQSKYNLSRLIEQWLQPAVIMDEREPHLQQTATNASSSSNNETKRASEDILRQPLLGGGQGEKNKFDNVFAQPQGDVNADVGTNNKLPTSPSNRGDQQPPKRVNSSNLYPHDINAERVQPTSTQAQQLNGSATGIITQSVSNHLEGLLPPIIEATGNLFAGKDIEKLRLQNKRRRHVLQEHEARSSAWTTYKGDMVLPPSAPVPEKCEEKCARQGLQCPTHRGSF
jgi:hypothetical protein